MPCYALNPVLLITSDCTRSVCIHCRDDISLPASLRENGAGWEELERYTSQWRLPYLSPVKTLSR
jgi:hypothetical protein